MLQLGGLQASACLVGRSRHRHPSPISFGRLTVRASQTRVAGRGRRSEETHEQRHKVANKQNQDTKNPQNFSYEVSDTRGHATETHVFASCNPNSTISMVSLCILRATRQRNAY